MKIEHARLVSAPIERVFGVFTDLQLAAEHISGIESIEVLTDQPFGVGTRWKETRKVMGKLATETMWITAVESNRSYTVQAESCGTRYTSVFTFDSGEGGTRVTMAFAGRPVKLWAWLWVPMGLLMAGAVKKMVAQDLADLAAVCEADRV